MIFFTSDHHFGHANIILHAKRPYSCVEEMDEDLIRKWNEVISPRDEVYHLGDFSFEKDPGATFSRLNGKKTLIKGNHDSSKVTNLDWIDVKDYLELNYNGTRIVLSHYPFHSWNRSHHGSVHFHGHSHGLSEHKDGRIDVGVDIGDLNRGYPFSIEEAIEIASYGV